MVTSQALCGRTTPTEVGVVVTEGMAGAGRGQRIWVVLVAVQGCQAQQPIFLLSTSESWDFFPSSIYWLPR